MKLSQKTLIALLACILQLAVGANLNNSTENLRMEVEQSSVSPIIALVRARRKERLERLEHQLANPNEPRIILSDGYVIICQLVEWGFEHFNRSLEHVEKNTMQVTLTEDIISQKEFDLICKMMEGTKRDWAIDELIEILEIGENFLVSGEAKEKIIFNVAMEILEGKLDGEIITEFPLFEAEISIALDALQDPAISTENENGIEFLQLDGRKVPEERKYGITKYFIFRAKTVMNAKFIKFKFTKDIIKDISEQLRNELIVFYKYNSKVTSCLGKDFEMFYEDLCNVNKLYFTIGNSQNISSSIKAIEAKKFECLDIFNSQMNILDLDLREMLSKMRICGPMRISGDFNVECFKEFYFKMKAAISRITIHTTGWYTSYLNFFTSLQSPGYFKNLLIRKERDIWNEGRVFFLQLIESSDRIADYEKMDFQSEPFTHLLIYIDNCRRFDLLKGAFNNDKIIAVNLAFNSVFNQFDELMDILKEKSFLLLTLETSNVGVENEQKFVANLSKTSFWNELEYLNFNFVSLQAILIGLEYLPCNLKNLTLRLPGPSNGQFSKMVSNSKEEKELKNQFVEELKISYLKNFDYTSDFEQLQMLFPNLRKLTIDGNNKHLKPFNVLNVQLKELVITCDSLDNEDNFIKELMNSPSLTSVHIEISEKVIRWKKEDGRIYAKFEVVPRV